MISQTVEYALRAVVTIAQHRGTPCTAQQLSRITRVPAPYLSKLLQGLVRSQVVTSKRGLHGGFLLTKDPAQLTIWEVIDAVEPWKRIRECPLNIEAHSDTLCGLHQRLDHALALVEESFRSTSVADVLAPEGQLSALCGDCPLVELDLSGSVGVAEGRPSAGGTTPAARGRSASSPPRSRGRGAGEG